MWKLNRLFAAAQEFWNAKDVLRDWFMLTGYQTVKGIVINRDCDRPLARMGSHLTIQLLNMLVSLVHLWINARPLTHSTRRRATSQCPRQ